VVVDIKVIPRAAKSEVVGTMADGTLKVKVAAVPEDGKANEELRRLLATHFNVSLSSVAIVSGQSSQRKRVRVDH
jgi:uncharacterized protein (TIGR00251 family)